MCEKAVEENPWYLEYIPDHFKTQETCDAVVMEDPWLLMYVPDWFLMQGLIKIWHDDNMMTMIIAIMMINLLSGMMVIKNAGFRKQK